MFIQMKHMQIKWTCIKLYPPISSRNWISCITIICYTRFKNNDKKYLSNRNAKSSWPSVLHKWGSWKTIAAATAKSLTNAKVEHLWDSSFSWELFLTSLPGHKINWLGQLRGFIPGIVLNWIKVVAASPKLDPPVNSQNWISWARLDHAFYLNKYCNFNKPNLQTTDLVHCTLSTGSHLLVIQ